jgi:hypothetical protein
MFNNDIRNDNFDFDNYCQDRHKGLCNHCNEFGYLFDPALPFEALDKISEIDYNYYKGKIICPNKKTVEFDECVRIHNGEFWRLHTEFGLNNIFRKKIKIFSKEQMYNYLNVVEEPKPKISLTQKIIYKLKYKYRIFRRIK